MLKRILLALSLFASPALAADFPVLPVKVVAPAVPACTILHCTGFYAGGGLSGVATNLNVFANGINGSLNAGGTILDIHAGWRSWNGSIYIGGEVSAGYDVAINTGAVSVSPSDRFNVMELVKLGGNISGLLGSQGTFTFPAALQPYFMSWYIIAGGKQKLAQTGIVGGIGAEFVIGPKSTINLEYLNTQWGGGGAGISTPAGTTAAITNENTFRLSYNWNF